MSEPLIQLILLAASLVGNGLLSIAFVSMRFSSQRLLADLANNTTATAANAKATQDVREEVHGLRNELNTKFVMTEDFEELESNFEALDRDFRERLVKVESGMTRMKELDSKIDEQLIKVAKLETDVAYRFGPPPGNTR